MTCYPSRGGIRASDLKEAPAENGAWSRHTSKFRRQEASLLLYGCSVGPEDITSRKSKVDVDRIVLCRSLQEYGEAHTPGLFAAASFSMEHIELWATTLCKVPAWVSLQEISSNRFRLKERRFGKEPKSARW